MKISLNWLKKFVKITVPDEELIRLIGARLVEVEGVIDESHKYDKIYVVRVVKAEKIPDTHLTLCQIDCGDMNLQGVERNAEGLVQVVCGAPNVRAGMLAAWIAPGAVVPASVHEDAPFVIGKRKMLGKYESNGMLAGADELDFGDDHSGIVEIDPNQAEPGEMLSSVFELDDLILEIENKSLTHRPDCFGLIGFSREVAGILGEKFEYQEIEARNIRDSAGLKIEIENHNICARYTALVLEKHGEVGRRYLSFIDTILAKSGMRPMDPVVDATNYMMLLTGQPLHAFDCDKFVKVGGESTPRIVVRLAREGEKLVLLDDKEISLAKNDIVICSGEVPVALAGAMGGKSTICDENTRRIILESATFSLYNLRKTQMAHGIFSEAITRFTKGQPPYQTLSVAESCAEMLAGGFRVVGAADRQDVVPVESVVEVTVEQINGLLGTDYSEAVIVRTLENVGFAVKRRGHKLRVIAPAWRTDIHIKEDIIEEVGRLLGYDNIKPVLPRHRTAERNKMFALKSEIREIMRSFGANELLTYSFVSEKLLKRAGLDIENSYRIVNSISPELQLIRQSIVPSLLDKAYLNEKLPVEKFAIYEMNKVYSKDAGYDKEKVPVEGLRLGCVLAERKSEGAAYYKVRRFLMELLKALGIDADTVPYGEHHEAMWRPFEPKRSADVMVGDECIGVVGEFKNSVRLNFKLEPYLAGFEIDLTKVSEYASVKKRVNVNLEKETRDLTVTSNKSYGEIVRAIAAKLAEEDTAAEILPINIYQPEVGERRVSLYLVFDSKVDDGLMQELEKINIK